MTQAFLPLPRKNFLAIALVLLGTCQGVSIAATDIANSPLASASSGDVKPNVFFILDDSGSMDREYMPDALDSRTSRVGFRNAQCNTVYYNPNVSYTIPKYSTGTNLNDATQTIFTSAYKNGFYSYDGGSSTKVNLSSAFRAFEDISSTNDTAQAGYYWKYLGATTLVPITGDCEKSLASSTDSTTREICTDNTRYGSTTTPTTCAGASKTALWRKITVSSTSGPGSTDEQQNFANWYSYYRTRLMMMKAASGRAFQTLADNYRVGFMTISPGTYNHNSNTDAAGEPDGDSINAAKFLKIANFDAPHRADWYTKLYSQTTSLYTPLRAALTTAGRYYAGKNDGTSKGMIPNQADDPVQYSCQQNFAILTTDGYWNGGSGRQIDGTSVVGNQDGVISEQDAYRAAGNKYYMAPRPIFDGASQTYTWNTAENQYRNVSCVLSTQWQQRTIQWQQRTVTDPLGRSARFRKCSKNGSGGDWGSCTTIYSNCSSGTGDAAKPYCRITDVTAWTTTNPCTPGQIGATSNTRECQAGTDSGWINVASCTVSSGGGTTITCQTASDTGWANVGSCTASAPAGGPTVTCQSIDTLGYMSQYYSTITRKTYPGPNQSGTQLGATVPAYVDWTNIDGVCHAAAPAVLDTGAAPAVGPPSPPEGCTSGVQQWPCETYSSGGGGVTATISSLAVAGSADPYTVTATTSADHPFQVGHSVNITSVTTDYGGYREVIEVPDNRHFKYLVATHPGVSDGSGTATLSSGSSDSLADVAQHYYKTDLRRSDLGNCTGGLSTSVCDNNVPSTGTGVEDDRVNWQHMTTFTMGLGLTGTVQYSSTYKTDSPDSTVTWPATNGQITGRLDFQDIRKGTANWPIPVKDTATALDDLWHAAANGRGQYFSAADPEAVVSSLTSALSGISARVASAAAAATSNLEPVAGDNFAYTAKYTTQKWTGELEAREIDLATGAVSGTAIWSAATKLDALAGAACDNRVIKLFRSGASNNLVDFKWSTDTCDAAGSPVGSPQTTLNATEQAYFGSTQVNLFSHQGVMSAAQKTAAAGANLVNYLRGQRSNEGFDTGPPITTDINKLYRTRDSRLGDIVNAQPVFVKAPFGEYLDAGYVDFRTNYSGRTPVVYVAANDGLLHAFKAGTSLVDTEGGKEAWAFMPTMVLPYLYKMASEEYATDHTYSVDGTPTAADIFDKTASADCALASPTAPEACWKTILVGGLNKGGSCAADPTTPCSGYYALDVTDPASPKALWEFKKSGSCITVDAVTKAPTATAYSDCHLGYTFNNPVIGKLSDGTWAVFVTSGYNNDDGIGYLYVLNAATGQILYRISTGVGSAADPSGLNHINAWVDNALINNTITRVYGVDLLGNIWRFDVNNTIGPAGREAQLVAQAVNAGGTPQPITTRPELAEIAGEPFVYVGTGRYLGLTDKENTDTQSVWAIKDPMTSATPLTDAVVTDLRTTLGQRTITNVGSGTSAYRTVTATSCTTGDGWFADLPDTRERVNIDIKLQLGTLVVPSNVPEVNACNVGGYGWLNYFNYTTGCAVANSTNGSVGQRLVGSSGTESLAVGINIVRLPGGKTVVIATTSAAEQITFDAPFDTPPPVGKRVSWREIVQ